MSWKKAGMMDKVVLVNCMLTEMVYIYGTNKWWEIYEAYNSKHKFIGQSPTNGDKFQQSHLEMTMMYR